MTFNYHVYFIKTTLAKYKININSCFHNRYVIEEQSEYTRCLFFSMRKYIIKAVAAELRVNIMTLFIRYKNVCLKCLPLSRNVSRNFRSVSTQANSRARVADIVGAGNSRSRSFPSCGQFFLAPLVSPAENSRFRCF